jgi:hypothetical protein
VQPPAAGEPQVAGQAAAAERVRRRRRGSDAQRCAQVVCKQEHQHLDRLGAVAMQLLREQLLLQRDLANRAVATTCYECPTDLVEGDRDPGHMINVLTNIKIYYP